MGRGPSLELGTGRVVTMPGRGATERRQEVGIGGDAQDVRLGGPPDNSSAGPTHNALRLGNLAARERAVVLAIAGPRPFRVRRGVEG
jgi:hypothetical protein